MYGPIPEIRTEVFARLDDRLRINGRKSDWVDLHRHGKPTDSFLEGPIFAPDGSLFCVDIPYGRIFSVGPDGRFAVRHEYDGEPNGLTFGPEGSLYIADFRRGLLRLQDNRLSTVLDGFNGRAFRGLNDLVFGDRGDLWFTDQGLTGLHDPSGILYRWKDDLLTPLLSNIPSPNGLVWAVDGHSIFVAVTRGNCVWRVPFGPDGNPFKVGLFCQLSGGVGPDGLAIDPAGNLFVCHPGTGSVWVFHPSGEPMYRIRSCTGLLTTNCTLGPAGLYVTESETGTILFASWPR